jgi:hypothetical protein
MEAKNALQGRILLSPPALPFSLSCSAGCVWIVSRFEWTWHQPFIFNELPKTLLDRVFPFPCCSSAIPSLQYSPTC